MRKSLRGMMRNSPIALLVNLALFIPSMASEVAILTSGNWEQFAPRGKEADAIFGDFVIRNDKLVAVIASLEPERNANMTVWGVGGAVIDLTLRDQESDQLSAFFPGDRIFSFEFDRIEVDGERIAAADILRTDGVTGTSVSLFLVSPASDTQPRAELQYRLEEGAASLLVETHYLNAGSSRLELNHFDRLRVDNTRDGLAIEKIEDGIRNLYWAYDKWFGQAYGVLPREGQIEVSFAKRSRSASELKYLLHGDGSIELDPGETFTLTRNLFPASNLLHVKTIASSLSSVPTSPLNVQIVDLFDVPVAGADVQVYLDGELYGWGRSFKDGQICFKIPEGRVFLRASDVGRGLVVAALDPAQSDLQKVILPEAGSVLARIRDDAGKPIPCKAQFSGRLGTPDPFFGPDSGEQGVHNARYSANGEFTQILTPGLYDVIISHGPEHDAVFTEIEIAAGNQTLLEATLKRTVDTRGWVSADFHGHASPSGDNTSSQLGRVLNLLAENIEFAPCTEHNRISTYVPHLTALGANSFMATCSGLELTSSPGGLNHHNAFPLVRKEHTQDNGAPRKSEDPEIQIERLALWDDNSDKLVQQNHPDMETLFFDRDEDGARDQGYSRMFEFMDVIELHPLGAILWKPFTEKNPVRADPITQIPNRIHFWMQTLNEGHRIPGVVNTDAHSNFHGSGWRRNYVKSSTDDPAQVETMDIVHAAERGNLIMTNGPFLQVWMESEQSTGTAGDDIAAFDGLVRLKIQVQCPNWFDIDRVQVFLNGLADSSRNFSRATHAPLFSNDTTRFSEEIEIKLTKDTHVIVAAMGENSRLGPVMGPGHQEEKPVAISNPIFVDVDGGGFDPKAIRE